MAKIRKLSICGGKPLNGKISVSGAKNSSVAIIPATLLAGEPCTLENLPDIEDVRVVKEILEWVGARVEFENNEMWIDPTGVNRSDVPARLAQKMRASYYFVPVLLGLFGEADVPMPGGCKIGARPIDQTLKGWRMLGADAEVQAVVELDYDKIVARNGKNMRGREVLLDMPSVGATINTMLAAVSAEGLTIIRNAAKEPHVVDLANFLNTIGAKIRGAGTADIRIWGRQKMHGGTYSIVPDQIETGTLMIAAAATRGDVTIAGAVPFHMEALTAKLLEAGVRVEDDEENIFIHAERGERDRLRHINVTTQTYPGFPTDLQQPMVAMLTTAGSLADREKKSVVSEKIYESRFEFVNELVKMGAQIDISEDGRVAHIYSVEKLSGTHVKATDLRAGAAMVVAGLMAEGRTIISNVHFIERGYENIVEKFRSLGADIEMIEEEEDEQ